MSDLLSTARTPTEAETEAGAKAYSGLNDMGWSGLHESDRNGDRNAARIVLYAALPVAAPRILALAYRDAAQRARYFAATLNVNDPIDREMMQAFIHFAKELESQAAALEKEVPNG